MLNDIVLHSAFGFASIYLCLSKDIKWIPLIRRLLCWMIVAYLLFSEVQIKKENFYEILSLSIHSTKQEIRASYKSLDKLYHLDRNKDVPDATERHRRLKKAYEILMHDTKRSNYYRFGDYKDGEVDERTAILVVCMSLMTQIFCFVVAFFCTFPKSIRFARQLVILYSIGCFCLELQFRFVEEDETFSWIPFFNKLLPFEKANFLRSIYPSILCISMIIADYLHSDKEIASIFLMKCIVNSNRLLSNKISSFLLYASSFDALGGKTCLTTATTAMHESEKSEEEISEVRKLKTWKYFSESLNATDKGKLTEVLRNNTDEENNESISSSLSSTATTSSSSSSSSVDWLQVLIWGIILLFWVYFK